MYDITAMLNKHSFIKSCERDPFRIQITPQHNSFKTRMTPKLATAIRYLIYKHILSSPSYSCVSKRNSTAMVTITLKTILMKKAGYHFCQVILLFWLRQKVQHIRYINYRIMNIFVRSSRGP